jgi:hypothetical protein
MGLYLNKTPPQAPWLSPALSVAKSSLLDQDPGTPILDVGPPHTQSLQGIAGNDDPNASVSGVRVQLWALAFGTAAVGQLYLSSVGGTKGILVPSGGGGITLGAGQEQPFSAPWNASTGLTSDAQEIKDRFVNNEVHCCIFGNVYNDANPGQKIPDNPGGPVLDVVNNPRHAQRNMTIKTLATDSMLRFAMFTANPRREDGLFRLRLRERRELELEVDELAALEGRVDGDARELRRPTKPLKDLELEIDGEGGGGPEREVKLAGNKERRMWVKAKLPKEAGVLAVFDIEQTAGDELIGGARLMVLTASKKPRPKPKPKPDKPGPKPR